MAEPQRLLPPLTLNRRLLKTVMDDGRPTFALGFVEERRAVLPLLVVSLPELDDLSLLGDGVDLGCQAATGAGGRALRLDFRFPEVTPLQAVVDVDQEPARQVVSAISTTGAYFVLVVGYSSVKAFRADTGATERQCIGELLASKPARTSSRGSFASLRKALVRGSDAVTLEWVASGDASLLSLQGPDRHELRSAH